MKRLLIAWVIFFGLPALGQDPQHATPSNENNKQSGDSSSFDFLGELQEILDAAPCSLTKESFREKASTFRNRFDSLADSDRKSLSIRFQKYLSAYFDRQCDDAFLGDDDKKDDCIKIMQKFWGSDSLELMKADFPTKESYVRWAKMQSKLFSLGYPLSCKATPYKVGAASPSDATNKEAEHERIVNEYLNALIETTPIPAIERSKLIWKHGARIARLLRQDKITLDGINYQAQKRIGLFCKDDLSCINKLLPELKSINQYFWQDALAEEQAKGDSEFYNKKIFELKEEDQNSMSDHMDEIIELQKRNPSSIVNRSLDKIETHFKENRNQDEIIDSEKLLVDHYPKDSLPNDQDYKIRNLFIDPPTVAPISKNALSAEEEKLISIFKEKTGFSINALANAFLDRKTKPEDFTNEKQMVVVDHSLPNSKKRICVLNLKTQSVRCDFVANSKGSGKYLTPQGASKNKYFGNEAGMLLGTFGSHVTVGKSYWASSKNRYQRTIRGREIGVNDRTDDDGKVLHRCVYSEYGRSHGCVATDSEMDKILQALPAGTQVYIYPGKVERVPGKKKISNGKYRPLQIWKVIGA